MRAVLGGEDLRHVGMAGGMDDAPRHRIARHTAAEIEQLAGDGAVAPLAQEVDLGDDPVGGGIFQPERADVGDQPEP